MCLRCRPGGSDVGFAYAEARSLKTWLRRCWNGIIFIFTFYFAAVTGIAAPNTRGSCPSHHTPSANILERAAERYANACHIRSNVYHIQNSRAKLTGSDSADSRGRDKQCFSTLTISFYLTFSSPPTVGRSSPCVNKHAVNLKAIIRPKMKILTAFTHARVVPNLSNAAQREAF